MSLHLLGKKSWNVYNADNIARVKADEAAAAAREAAEEQRIQEFDAARRAAILRGESPPPPPPDETRPHKDTSRRADHNDGHDRKRRKLAGEDDTDRDIRLAASIKGDGDETADCDARLLRLRKPTSDAPLLDRAGNINLFPVDLKEEMKHEKNEEAEKEKRKKERAREDQYTMRFSNAAGRRGLEQQPWYASKGSTTAKQDDKASMFPDLDNKNVWGNEDPLRKEREHARLSLNDPFALMQRAQAELKKSKEDKKKWAAERERELTQLRATQERSSRRGNHEKRKKRADDEDADHVEIDGRDKRRSSLHKHPRKERNRSRERRHERPSSHRDRERRRSCSRDEHTGDASHHRRQRKLSSR